MEYEAQQIIINSSNYPIAVEVFGEICIAKSEDGKNFINFSSLGPIRIYSKMWIIKLGCNVFIEITDKELRKKFIIDEDEDNIQSFRSYTRNSPQRKIRLKNSKRNGGVNMQNGVSDKSKI